MTNVDLVCLDVEYMAVPCSFRGLELSDATLEEVRDLERLLGKSLDPVRIKMLGSGGRRFPVIAWSFTIAENDWDIFESPFEFRSHFRGDR
jgi:hypothetical protein